MRSLVTTTFVLALALAPAAAFSQQPPAQQPPATQQPPAQQPSAAGQQPPAQPAAGPKLAFTTNAGMLLLQVKPDQTATFEEMIGKIKTGGQGTGWKVYKAQEPAAGGNVMYVVLIDPATPNSEYQFFELIQKTLTDEQKRDPATAEMYKKYAAAIAGMNKLNVTPIGG